MKVLVAHGNTKELRRVVTGLQVAGASVTATPDGGDAFARFFEEAPDLVICSANLPSISGPNIARMVRSQTMDVPVVILLDDVAEQAEVDVISEGDDAAPVRVTDDLREIATVMTGEFSVSALLSALPELDFSPEDGDDSQGSGGAGSAGQGEVFVVAALRRFQRDNNLLAIFDDSGLQRVAGVAQYQVCDSEKLIIRQGDPGNIFYFVVEGQVRVTLDGDPNSDVEGEQEEREVARINAGGFFGEMALLNNQPRTASVSTVGAATLLSFEREAFMPLLTDYPIIREVLTGVASQRKEANLWRSLFDEGDVEDSIDSMVADIAQDDKMEVAAEPEVSVAVVDDSDAPALAPASGAQPLSADEFAPVQEGALNLFDGEDLHHGTDAYVGGLPSADASHAVLESVPEPGAGAERFSTGNPHDSDAPIVDLPPIGALSAPGAWHSRSFAWGALVGVAAGVLAGAWITAAMLDRPPAQDQTGVALQGHEEAASGDHPTTVAAVEDVSPTGAAPADESAPDADGGVGGTAETAIPQDAMESATPNDEPPTAIDAESKNAAVVQGKVASTGSEIAERKRQRKVLMEHYKAGRHREAATVGRALRAAFTIDWEAERAIAQAERRAGMLEKALLSYVRFYVLFPDNAYADEARWWAADIHIIRGRKSRHGPAARLLQSIIDNPESARRDAAAERLGELDL